MRVPAAAIPPKMIAWGRGARRITDAGAGTRIMTTTVTASAATFLPILGVGGDNDRNRE